MKLKIRNTSMNKVINDLQVGELFVVRDEEKDQYKLFQGIFMKINNNKDERNAVKLDSGELYYINKDILLQSINGELVV